MKSEERPRTGGATSGEKDCVGWVILDGTGADGGSDRRVISALQGQLEAGGQDYALFNLGKRHISPCRSCGSCGFKTAGRCVIDDDMQEVLRAVAATRVLTFVSPVTFGGYSSDLKKAVDRLMPLGLPYYTVRKGHLLHLPRYGHLSLLGIGTIEAEATNVSEQAESFRFLVSRNALNMMCAHHRTLTLDPSVGGIETAVSETMREALRW